MKKKGHSKIKKGGHFTQPLLYCLGVLVFSCSVMGLTLPKESLYKVRQVVADQSAKTWQQAVQTGLTTVLVKVSGQPTPMNSELIQEASSLAGQFVNHYHYLVNPENPSTLTLEITYDFKAINHLLHHAGLGVWGTQRPLLIVWLVEQDDTQAAANEKPKPVLLDRNDPTLTELKKHIEARGLPIVFPLFNAYDPSSTPAVQSVWSMDIPALEQASTAYRAEALLIGQLKHHAQGSWSAHWVLKWEGGLMRWDSQQKQANDLLPLLSANLDQVIDTIVSQASISEGNVPEKSLQLTIHDMNNLTDYAKLTHYLNSLSMITHFSGSDFDPSTHQVRLQLKTKSSLLSLKHALESTHQLQPMPTVHQDHRVSQDNLSSTSNNEDTTAVDTPVIVLNYRWHSQ